MAISPDIDSAERASPHVALTRAGVRLPGETAAVSDLDATLDTCRDGTVLLTVNRRLARDLTARYERRRFEEGASWWETPTILPLSRWLERLHDESLTLGLSTLTRLTPLLAERRWHALIERDRAVTLLSPLATARQAMRAWQLGHAWGCMPDENDYLPLDQYHWRRWARDYAEGVAGDGLVDEATLAAHVIGLIATGGLTLPDRVVLSGFLSLTPAVGALLGALDKAGVEVVAVADDPPRAPRAVLWADDASELAGIAAAVRSRLEREPGAVLGVVIPDLDARRAEVLRAFDRRFFPAMTPLEIERIGRPYDLSLGVPLTDTAAVRSALLALQLFTGSLEQRDLATLLLSPYLGFHDSECRERERLDRRLRVGRVQRLDLGGLIARLETSSRLRRSLARLAAERRDEALARRALASEWVERFARVLEAFGWADEELGSEEFQAVRAWWAVLADLGSLEDDTPIGVGEALALVRHLASERMFQPETPELPVRVLGRLESHGQRFDVLWVAGLDTERWPPSGSPSPFLPIAAQQAVGMPEASSAARLELARAEFSHWCSAAPEMVASRAAEREGKVLDSASVLGVMETGVLEESVPAELIAAAVTVERVDDAVGPTLDAGGEVAGGARLFEDQAACPFRAFATHRLGARELEEVGGGLDGRQSGTLLHRALEYFWREVRTHEALLTAIDSEALDETIVRSVDAALEAERVDPLWHDLERRRLGPLLHQWLVGQERGREPFEVVAFEASRETVHGGVRVRLAIDRVDRLVGPGIAFQGMTDDEAGAAALPGDRVVLDYKSGARNGVGGWAGTRIDQPQLPLYALLDERVVGVGYAQVVADACRFKGAVASDGLLPRVAADDVQWSERRSCWRDALDTVGREVAGGEAGVSPVGKACQFCRLRALCRLEPDGEVADDEESSGEDADESAS